MTDLTIFSVVAAVACAAIIIVVVVQKSHDGGREASFDTDRQHRWLIDAAPAPARRILESVDRRVAGGAVGFVAFAALFSSMAFVGWIFSGVDAGTGVARWDASAAEFGRDRATESSTRVLDAVTDLGSSVFLFVVMALIGVYHSVRRSDTGPLHYLVTVGVGVALLNNGLKLLIDRDRPDLAQLAESAGSSFPSGHTAAAAACWAAIATVVSRRRHRVVRAAVTAWAISAAVAVAATRVLLGVHWLSDVVAGLLVGWGWWMATTVLFGARSLRFGVPVASTPVRNAHDTSGDCSDDTNDLRTETSSR